MGAESSSYACPFCRKPLEKISSGFSCPHCRNRYPVRNGIPVFLPPEDRFLENHFFFAGKDIPRLAEKITTPFYLFSERIIEENFRQLKTAFSLNGKLPLKIYYSAKTNFEPEILKTIKNLGGGLEIAWGLELALAKKLKFKPEDLCFDGPVKSEEDLADAIRWGVAINADSYEEAEKISRIAGHLKKKVLIGFRVNPGFKSFLLPPLTGYFSKFGIPIFDAFRAYLKARRLPYLVPAIISSHLGSQITTPNSYLKLVGLLAGLSARLEKRGLAIRQINIGGGFPSAGLRLGWGKIFLNLAAGSFFFKSPPLYRFGVKIAEKFLKETSCLKNRPWLAIEPGRSLVGNAGIFVCRAAVIKKNGWVFLDGSQYAVSESLFFSGREIVAAARYHQPPEKTYRIAGPTLNSGDIFRLKARLPKLKTGDIIVILDAGAYSVSRAVPFTAPIPAAYYLRRNGGVALIRRKGTYADSLAPCYF